MSTFKCEKSVDAGGILSLLLRGDLNESAVLPEIAGAIGSTTQIEIQFSNLRYISSSRVGLWVKWVKKEIAPLAGVRVHFHRCPKFVIDQVNDVVGFLPPNASVRSFFVPFFSPKSGETTAMLFEPSQVKVVDAATGRDFRLRDVFDSSGNLMEPDVSLPKYFRFL